MQDNIAILVVFFNKLEETTRCIESFLPLGVAIHVLNNGSKITEWTALTTKFASATQCRFYHFDENKGPAQGRNYLIQQAKEDWLFLVDNDITIQPGEDWTDRVKEALAADSEADVILPRLWNVHEASFAGHPRFQLMGNRLSLNYDQQVRANYFPSGAAIIKRNVFSRFGLFDDGLFAFEDYEYAVRLLKKGESLHIQETAAITLVHDHRFQKKRIDKMAVRERYNEERLEKSFALVAQKHAIVFDHDWQWWSRKQVREMTGTTIFKRLKDKFKQLTTR